MYTYLGNAFAPSPLFYEENSTIQCAGKGSMVTQKLENSSRLTMRRSTIFKYVHTWVFVETVNQRFLKVNLILLVYHKPKCTQIRVPSQPPCLCMNSTGMIARQGKSGDGWRCTCTTGQLRRPTPPGEVEELFSFWVTIGPFPMHYAPNGASQNVGRGKPQVFSKYVYTWVCSW